jgi:regulator of sigma E protease
VSFSWLSVPGFLVAVCVLVTVHEYGHYWVARRLGFKVLRFSVGFGRALWTRVAGPDRTEYIVAAVPLGGYVRLLDERDGPVSEADLPRSFTRRPHWQRIAMLLAGPAANFVFAILLLAGMLLVSGSTELRPLLGAVEAGSPAARAGARNGAEIVAVNGHAVGSQRAVEIGLIDSVISGGSLSVTLRDALGQERSARLALTAAAGQRALSDPDAVLEELGLRFQEPPLPPVLGSVFGGGPAARAGLQAGDEILSVNGEPVHDFRALVSVVRAHPGETLSLQYRRDGRTGSARVAVGATLEKGVRIGRIEVGGPRLTQLPPGLVRHVKLGPFAALGTAAGDAWELTVRQAHLLWGMLGGTVSVSNLGGVIAIAQQAGESAAAGPGQYLVFLVSISLMLGLMNLLPIPILDGGQIVLQAVEWLKGSPLPERVHLAGQQLGIAMVVLLLGLALYNDISRLFG